MIMRLKGENYMKNLFSKSVNAVRKFNSDESGMETMQVVMILAIAAIVGVAVYAIGKNVVKWGDESVTNVIDSSSEYEVSGGN